VRIQNYVALIAFMVLRILHQTAARAVKASTLCCSHSSKSACSAPATYASRIRHRPGPQACGRRTPNTAPPSNDALFTSKSQTAVIEPGEYAVLGDWGLLVCSIASASPAIELVHVPTLSWRIEHFQGAAAGVDLVVTGEIRKAFEDAEQVLVPGILERSLRCRRGTANWRTRNALARPHSLEPAPR
jgi:hypothetical protein